MDSNSPSSVTEVDIEAVHKRVAEVYDELAQVTLERRAFSARVEALDLEAHELSEQMGLWQRQQIERHRASPKQERP